MIKNELITLSIILIFIFLLILTLVFINLNYRVKKLEPFKVLNQEYFPNNHIIQSGLSTKEIDKVYIFLSSNCSKCRELTPELDKIISRNDNETLDIKFIVLDNKDNYDYFNKLNNFDSVIFFKKNVYNELNPNRVFPAYVFLDKSFYIDSQGVVGDQGWNYFLENIG
ncbi:hypothetical protein [Vibrio campbellii]|uniref:hypothetical protein n=2 Tax=Vibrio campbellii TaxID=680 RepID=UPI00390C5F04